VKIIAQIAITYELIRWEEKTLIETAKELGVQVKPVHLRSVFIPLGCASENTFREVDVVLQRAISHSIALNSTIALESLGLRVVNSSLAIAVSVNKLWTLKILSQSGIPVPQTVVSFDFGPSVDAAKALGYPVVIKPIDGSWGRLIAMARDNEELRALIEHRNYIPNPTMKVNMIQEYVKKFDRDIRVFVVGDQAVAAMYRINREHWITNVARGALTAPARLDSELEELALRVAKAVGGEVLGIDVFEHPDQGYIVNEVNAMPEFKALTSTTGVPVHAKIIEYLKGLARR